MKLSKDHTYTSRKEKIQQVSRDMVKQRASLERNPVGTKLRIVYYNCVIHEYCLFILFHRLLGLEVVVVIENLSWFDKLGVASSYNFYIQQNPPAHVQQHWVKQGRENFPSLISIHSVRVINQQLLYCCGKDGVLAFDHIDLKQVRTIPADDIGYVYDVAEMHNGEIAIAAGKGLFRLIINGKEHDTYILYIFLRQSKSVFNFI